MPEPLSPDRLAEIRSSQIGDWYAEPWFQRDVDMGGDERDRYEVHTANGTVLAVLPDWAASIALWMCDAHEAVPQLLAENDRLRAELEAAQGDANRGWADSEKWASLHIPGAAVTVDELAQLIHAADVHVNNGHYPTWDQLSTAPGLGQDDVRKAARWLLQRLAIRAVVPVAAVEDGAQ